MITILCEDAKDFINRTPQFDSVITSLPDANETPFSLKDWETWFVDIVAAIVAKTTDYAIFYQTDRKADGKLLDKSYLVTRGAYLGGGYPVFHKIVLRKEPGKVDLYRPGFTHLQGISKTLKSGPATPDVLQRGEMIYPNAMGLDAARFACEFVQANTKKGLDSVIVDPFCGRGTVLKMAAALGFSAIGVDISKEQCDHAKSIQNDSLTSFEYGTLYENFSSN